MKSIAQILILTLCVASLALVSCNKKAEEPAANANAAAPQEPAVPADPAIDPKALVGSWIQAVDDDPVSYDFMENGKCKAKLLTFNAPRDCTYEIKSPEQSGGRFNTLVVDFPASGDDEHFYNKDRIRLAGDELTFPDEQGEVSIYNKYKKVDPNAAPAKADNAEAAPAYAGNINEDILGEWSEEVSEGPTVTYKFMPDGKCWYQDVMNEKGVDCTYKVSPDAANRFKLVVARPDTFGDMKDFEQDIEFKDGNLYFYLDNHPYKYNKK